MNMLRIIAVNDVYELANLPRLKTLVDNLGRQAQANKVVCTLAGDFLSPSTLSGMDKGASMVECLSAASVSHVCLGNHEADFGLKELKNRIREYQHGGGIWLNSNIPSLQPTLPTFDIIQAGNKRIGLLGLLLDDPTAFRDGTFRGHAILPVIPTTLDLIQALREDHQVDVVVPLTHQALEADIALAQAASSSPVPVPVILGGHDHHVVTETVGACTILKTGIDAITAAVVDLTWDRDGGLQCSWELHSVADHSPDAHVQALVDSHTAVLDRLQTEVVCSSQDGGPITSRGTRFQQTSVGALITSAMREEMKSDCAVLNGATIKGNSLYPEGKLTYLDLKQELPFPTKMVTMEMPGHVLQAALQFSRAGDATREKKGFLQVDDGMEVGEKDCIQSIQGVPFDPEAIYTIAIPRNLLTGFCRIEPLMAYHDQHPELMPDEDSFIPAINLVLGHYSKNLWRQLGSFDHLDTNQDDVIQREELEAALLDLFTHKPSPIMLENMLDALDADKDGKISREEWEEGLGLMERSAMLRRGRRSDVFK